MYKFYLRNRKELRQTLFKCIIRMKIILFIVLISLMHVQAETFAQNVNLNVKNATLRDVLDEIQKQTGYDFLYNSALINKKQEITLQVQNRDFKEILATVLNPHNLVFEVDKNLVLIRPGKLKPKPHIEADMLLDDQQRTLSGIIRGANGQLLSGVTIAVKGTSDGTISDDYGRFSLSVESSQILVFSLLGYTTKELSVPASDSMDVTLTESLSGLDEVVVVGYGTEQKKDLTGAVSTITAADIAGRQTVQVSQALQGAVSGVTVTRSGGTPGGEATVRVRGITTLGDNNPLIIVDGVPQGSLYNLNPNDVESISVLKDGASTAIYGSRAAAGVILVTTKRAKEGQSSFNYNYEFGLEKPTQLPEYADPVRYMQLYNEYLFNDGGAPHYSEDLINNYWDNHRTDPDRYPATDWQDVIINSAAPRHRHDLSFSVGTGKLKTNASLNYTNVDALHDNRSWEMYSARINNDLQVNDILSANFDVFFRRTDMEETTGLNPFYYTRLLPGIFTHRYQDGRLAPGREGTNPYADIQEGGFNQRLYNQLGGRLVFNAKPLPELSLTALIAPTLNFDKTKTFNEVVEFTDLDDPTRVVYRNRENTTLSEVRPEAFVFNGQFLVDYHKELGQGHQFDAMLGYEENYHRTESLSGYRGSFTLSGMPYLSVGDLDLRDNAGNASESALRSGFGRLKYNYKNKYYLQGNLRLDGSSRFHRNYRWGWFPSFSAAWTVSEEGFMRNIAETIPFLKFRFAWGTVGNERIGNYPYQASMEFDNALYYRGGVIVPVQTAAQRVYSVQNITWETTESMDVGLDIAFLRERLNVTADYYQKRTRDILLTLDIPSYLGFDAPNQNAGVVGAKGWDFEVNWKDNVGDLKYSIGANLSDVRTEIIDLKGVQIRGATAQIEGYEFNSWFGYRSDGLYQTPEEVENSPVLNVATRAGDVKYMDINEDGQITADDMVPLGGSLPRYMFGGTMRIDYKGFDFHLAFQGVGKVLSRLNSVQVEPFLANWGNMPTNIDGNFWSTYNSPEQNLAASYPRLSRSSSANNYQMSDFWLINGRYLRIKNITVGYTLPTSVVSKLRMQGLRVYLSANDMFSFHGFPRGWDPEVGSQTYPMVSTFMAGIRLTL